MCPHHVTAAHVDQAFGILLQILPGKKQLSRLDLAPRLTLPNKKLTNLSIIAPNKCQTPSFDATQSHPLPVVVRCQLLCALFCLFVC